MRSRSLRWLPLIVLVVSGCVRSLDEIADFSPRFSPDGERIVFQSDRNGEDQIYEVALDSGEVRKLTVLPGTAADPTYGADGQRVVFVYRAPGLDGYRLSTTTADGVEFLLAADYRVAFPDVRSDGSIVAACVIDDTFGICVIEPGDSAPTILFDDPTARDWEPVWSPDGSEVAFVSDRDGDDEIWLMNSDGSNIRQLTNNGDKDADPAWSPDGSMIAFDRSGTDIQIWIMAVDGSEAHAVMEGVRPAWSPDGNALAFYTSFTGYTSFGVAIAIAPLDGTSIRYVSQSQGEP